MIKKLIAASAILGVAAMLQNKERRERIFCAAKDLMNGAKAKAISLTEKAKDSVEKAKDSVAEMTSSSSGAGVTTRSSAPPPFRTSY